MYKKKVTIFQHKKEIQRQLGISTT